MDKDVQDRMAKRKSRFAEVAAATGQKPAGAVGNEIAEPRVCASMMAQTASDIFFVFQATQFAEAPTAAQVATGRQSSCQRPTLLHRRAKSVSSSHRLNARRSICLI
eukprot:TRINITY_DN2041_c0_g1_i7.p1 TRINITY_DN2041_c0_g1~~TRINITY_DN2041_c0_g1_i7.p1  ORF type:complete len:107 (+),score=4.46 TRINITY_DN2041_c0_g1_i7:258-578(+)